MDAVKRKPVARWWSPKPSETRGVVRRSHRYEARVWHGSQWVSIGLYTSRWWANRIGELARELKRLGKFLPRMTNKQIRELVKSHARQKGL